MSDPKLYYSPEQIELLKQNMHLSPHTIRLMNDPVHAYLCDGNCGGQPELFPESK